MTSNAVSIKFLKFGFVGVVVLGFDAVTFWLLLHVIPSSIIARCLSVAASIFLSWIINRSFTFAYSGEKPTVQEFIKFALSQLPGALVNALVSVLAFNFLPYIKSNPWISVALGSCAGMVLNFTIAHLYVFKNKNNQSPTL